MSAQRIYLVDGSGYIFRAYFAVQSLSAADGFPTNAIYGFTRMLVKLLERPDASHVAMAFDMGRETFRLAMYPEYKANRTECPEDLVPQMPYFRTVSDLFGVPVVELKGFEADDILATLAKRLSKAGHEVVIVSGDKDLMQLVDDKVSIWDTMHDRRFQREQVIEKFGVPPEQVVEALGLMGDSSDNVPGLDGVGPKTAAQLIQKYGSVENIIASVAAIREDTEIRSRKKIADTIEAGTEILRLSRKLVEVDTNTPVEFTNNGSQLLAASLNDEELVAALKRTPLQTQKLRELFERFRFTSLITELKLGASAIPQPKQTAAVETRQSGQAQLSLLDAKPVEKEAEIPYPVTPQYKSVLDKDFTAFVSQLMKQKEVSFDLETTSLDPWAAQLVGASFCFADNEAWYVPLGHHTIEGQLVAGQVPVDQFFSELRKFFSGSEILKSGQNLKYDLSVLFKHGEQVAGVNFDTMVAAYLLHPDRSTYNLTVLAEQYLQLADLPAGRIIEFDEVLGDVENFAHVAIDRATTYACQDAHCAWLIKQKLQPKLEAEDLLGTLHELEVPLVAVLARMELAGISIDTKLLAEMSVQFGADLEKVKAEIYEIAGGEFNINSPKQLSEVLFDKLGISTKGLKRTKTGISTDSSVLEKLSDQHPLPAKLLDYRFLFKLKNTYIDALPAQISPITGRLHTRFNQTVAGTGRLSSSDPNLQNIPIKTKEGARIRAGFVPASGMTLISADYSQIELRLLAHISGDENLIAAFQQDLDIHERTARELLAVPEGVAVSSEQRRIGKTMNFGIVYGMGGFRLSRELGIRLDEANLYIERYFQHFNGVKNFFAQLEHDAEKQGYVRTLMGRKRFLADIDPSGRDKGFILRAALNAPIQGSAADVIKKAMTVIDQRILREKLPLKMLLQIHDELVFECDTKALAEMQEIVRKDMEGVVALLVPLKVDCGSGPNWQAAQS